MRPKQLAMRAVASAVDGFNRSGRGVNRLEWLPRRAQRFYGQDELFTHNAQPFLDDPDFQRAYGRSVKVAGHDFGIPWRVHTILWGASLAAAREGAFVECGTGRGFMASAICEYLGWADRPFYLFDTFSPYSTDDAGVSVGPPNPYYAESVEAVRANFAEWPGVQAVVGEIPDSLHSVDINSVAFLHVDLNHAAPEELAIRHLWPSLVAGGVMILDDYGFPGYERQRESADDLARELGFRIYASPTGQGVVIK